MTPKLKLGFDNYAIRALGWKAPQLLDYAAELKLDTILLSDLEVYEDHTDTYFADLKAQAESVGVEIQVGMLSICRSSVRFAHRRGPPEEQLRFAIRIAKALGSPIVRCVLGEVQDRHSPGGIPARIAETVLTLQAVRRTALDAGIKIAVENHAGDLQSWELVTLIEEAGHEFVGATMDSGNAVWALEHPAESLEILGPYALSTGVRDSVVWAVPEGAMLQWTAIGEGSVNWKAYFERFAEICPETPVQIETISGRPIAIPFWDDEFWEAYRSARIPEFIKFVRMMRDGEPRPPFTVPDGEDPIRAEQAYQKAELERSVRYCREVLGLGRKS